MGLDCVAFGVDLDFADVLVLEVVADVRLRIPEPDLLELIVGRVYYQSY